MKNRSVFSLLVALVVVLFIFLVNSSHLVAVDESTFSVDPIIAGFDIPSTFQTKPRYDCRKHCDWAQDEGTRQFLEHNDSSKHRLELSILSSEGYGRMADLALGYHLSPSEAELLGNLALVELCLPRRVLIIYFYTDFVRRGSFHQLNFILNLTIPHVVIGTGWGNLFKKDIQLAIINNPYLLRWYGSSQERTLEDKMESGIHPKAYPLPVGLVAPINRFEQVKPIVNVNNELQESRRASLSTDDLGRTKLVLINFSASSEKAAHRQEARNLFCNSSDSNYILMNQTCQSGGFYDRNVLGRRRRYFLNEWKDMSPGVYKEWAQHKYTVSPRGQQKDCHRFWEAFYLGSVPIVLRREGYYQDLVQHYFQLPEEEVPILFVRRWRHVKPEYLEKMWKDRFVHLLRKPEWQWPQKLLTTDYVQDLIMRGIQDELVSRNDSSIHNKIRSMIPDPSQVFANRRRCYTPRSNDTMTAS